MQKHNRFVNEYVHHLPEVGPDVIGKPGVYHIVFYHDDWCKIYDGGGLTCCNCQPEVRRFAEPRRS